MFTEFVENTRINVCEIWGSQSDVYPKDGGIIFLRNVCKFLPSYRVSHRKEYLPLNYKVPDVPRNLRQALGVNMNEYHNMAQNH
jgi:hypothetical protein